MSRKLLTERLSSVLYHVTGLYNAYSILKSNEFRLTSAVGNVVGSFYDNDEYVLSKKKLFFMSFARSMWSKYYMYHYKQSVNVVFVVDGALLNSKYAGGAVNYMKDTGSFSYDNITQEDDEMEDRIFTDKPVIPNASRYITEIRVYVSPSLNLTDATKVLLRKLYTTAKLKRIPIYVWNDFNHYKLGRHKYAVRLMDLLPSASPNALLMKKIQSAYGTQSNNALDTKLFNSYIKIAGGHSYNKRDVEILLNGIRSYPEIHQQMLWFAETSNRYGLILRKVVRDRFNSNTENMIDYMDEFLKKIKK